LILLLVFQTFYLSNQSDPCHECAKLIIQAGIMHVLAPAPEGKWMSSNAIAELLFKEAGVLVEIYETP